MFMNIMSVKMTGALGMSLFLYCKGRVPRDFRLQVFYMWTPVGSRVSILDTFNHLFKLSAVWYCSYCLPLVSMTAMENLTPVSLIPVAILRLVSRWCTLTCEYLQEFSKKFKMTLELFSGAWGKMIHEKIWSKKSRDTAPLKKAN